MTWCYVLPSELRSFWEQVSSICRNTRCHDPATCQRPIFLPSLISEDLSKVDTLSGAKAIHQWDVNLFTIISAEQWKRQTSTVKDNFRYNVSSYCIYSNKCCTALITFFTPQVRRLIKCDAYLKIGRFKEIFSFNLMAYLPSVRNNYI